MYILRRKAAFFSNYVEMCQFTEITIDGLNVSYLGHNLLPVLSE